MRDRSFALGVAMTVAAALLFGTKGVLVKLAYPYGADATTLLALRMLAALPCFLVIAWWWARPPAPPLSRRDLALTAGLGLLGYHAASWLDFRGLELIDVATERMVLFIYPTLVVLIGWARGGERPDRRLWLALALTYAGVAVTWAGHPLGGSAIAAGVALVAASAVAYALFLVGAGSLTRRLGGVRFMALAMAAAACGVLLQAAATRPPAAWDLPAPVWIYGAVLGIAVTVVPGLLTGAGLRRIGAARAAVLGSIGPVMTVFLGWAVLGERPGALAWLGIALTLAGGVLIGTAGATKGSSSR